MFDDIFLTHLGTLLSARNNKVQNMDTICSGFHTHCACLTLDHSEKVPTKVYYTAPEQIGRLAWSNNTHKTVCNHFRKHFDLPRRFKGKSDINWDLDVVPVGPIICEAFRSSVLCRRNEGRDSWTFRCVQIYNGPTTRHNTQVTSPRLELEKYPTSQMTCSFAVSV